jgi:hypothetical protein
MLVPRTLSNLARCLIGVWMDSSLADVFERAVQRFHDIYDVCISPSGVRAWEENIIGVKGGYLM